VVTSTEIDFVTSNRGKFLEIEALFRPYQITVRWAKRELPEPQADTLEEVVAAKLAAAGVGKNPVLVEDSGLFIDALNGFPGVYSSYVFRTVGIGGILALLAGKPREATFRTVAGLRSGPVVTLGLGATVGTIAAEPRGSGGFGYDPIFIPSGESRTFAELTPEEKNRHSHRGQAIRDLAEKIARA